MQKIFNRKNTVVFTVLLLVCFITASSLLIVRDSFNNKAEEIIAAANKADGEGSELSEKLAGWLTNLLGDLTKEEGKDDKKDDKTDTVVDKKAEGYLKKGKVCLGFSIALYVLTVIFMGMDIACAAYSAYLESPKYEAKLRLMRMAEKRKKSMMK